MGGGILGSFNIGISGLAAAGGHLTIVGDNLANAATNGYKASRAEFQDVLATSLKGIEGGDQFGAGTKLAHIKPVFTQGNIARTDSITDMAISGNGFFTLKGRFGVGYTRDGSFNFNKDGQLINGDGHKVLGFEADELGKMTNKVGPIRLGNTTIPAEATKTSKLSMNLDSREDIKNFNIEKPAKSSSFNSTLTVYDNVGTARLISLFFNKVEKNVWEYHAAVDGTDAVGGEHGKLYEMASGQLRFSGKGVLEEEIEISNSFDFSKGAEPGQKIEFDFGESIKEGGSGLQASTQYGSDSAIARNTQDGSSAATLTSLSFNDEGILTAVYNNGETRDISQIAIAKFENNEGLFKIGKNILKESKSSGQAALGKPREAGRGEVLSKSVELSNVDIAGEFINLMAAQRNFQANTKTITTADQMLQEIMNIKR